MTPNFFGRLEPAHRIIKRKSEIPKTLAGILKEYDINQKRR